MTVSTQGIEIKTASRPVRAAVELLSSMRFSISLLTIICIASVIGTVLKQNEPLPNYVNQFGPFWAQVFADVHLYSVYSAWWFLLILAFLVTSTSLCIARNTPKILVDLKTYKENIREQSLKAFGHKASAELDETPEVAARRIGALLASGGWKVKLQARGLAAADSTAGGPASGWMVAAKAGAANKIGYIAAHSAIVLVCIGGLLDGDLVVRAQMLFNGKTAYTGGGMIADVKPEHRLGENNPTFRANLVVSEGARSSTAVLSQSDGVLIQDLPFSVELKKFIVEYYSTGMPKLFASDIVIHDKQTGEQFPARVEVNHPANYKGVEIYQSSFDDGGSTVKLKAVPMKAATKPFEVQGVIGGKSELVKGQGGADIGAEEKLTLEYTALRVINVENMSQTGGAGGAGVDVRKVDLRESIDARLGAANKTDGKKLMRNVGPSISYKLRDAAGQAREFNNYMLPIDTGDGVPVFLLGVRETPSDPFRYMRVPADEQGSMDDFLRLRAALADPAAREAAVKSYAATAVDPTRPELSQQLAASAGRALALFSGAETVKTKDGINNTQGGIQAIADFIEAAVPEPERAKAGEVLIRILNGALYELAQASRQQAGMKPFEPNEKTQGFMTQSVLALSDVQIYPAPMAMQLTDFTHVQASVFQVARAPGKNIVYLGCALLILGIFAMLYVRERRVWVWLAPAVAGQGVSGNASSATMALSSNRKTMDTDREFDELKAKLLGLIGKKDPST
jgi:cytochrome c biogenesis protein